MPRNNGRNKASPAMMTCKVDGQLLEALNRNLQALRNEATSNDIEDEEDGEGELDSTNLNSILQHILLAVNRLTESVREMKKCCEVDGKPVSTKIKSLEDRMRQNEDETDECCQRSMKGNFVIISKANPNNHKVSLIKTDSQLEEDEETLVQHVIDLAVKKYGVRITEDDIQACHRLPGGGIVLRLIRRGPGSSWTNIVGKIKEGFNSDMNVYFNFQLTRRRNGLIYELRQLKRDGKIDKFYSDENGQISVKIKSGDKKTKLTYSAGENGKPSTTVTLDELKVLIS